LSTLPLGFPGDQATPSAVSVSDADPTDANAPVERSMNRILTARRVPRTARMDRSEEYMEKLLLSPEEAARSEWADLASTT
jgi:hypothetical protein